MRFLKTLVLLAAVLGMAPVWAQSAPADNMQILREKLSADKKLVVAANMGLTESEAKGFWPVYEAYQKDLHSVNKRIGSLILDYADAYNKGPIEDATAKKLLGEMLDTEDAELALKRSYVKKLENVLPGWKVARYVQIENKIRAIVKYELAAEVPLAE